MVNKLMEMANYKKEQRNKREVAYYYNSTASCESAMSTIKKGLNGHRPRGLLRYDMGSRLFLDQWIQKTLQVREDRGTGKQNKCINK